MPGKIALTFDDGPNPPYTEKILDILKKANIKATFFVCGANAKRHPETVKRTAKEGHLISNHTYYHRALPTKLGINYSEINKTQKLIENLTSQKQKLYRPPWGHTPIWIRWYLKRQGFKIISYNAIGKDWQAKITPTKIATNVTSNVKNGSIILLHDGHNIDEGIDRSKTVAALQIIITGLKQKGFQFVSPLDL